MKLKVKDFQCVMHMDATTGSINIYEGMIDQPGHRLHDCKIHRSTFVPNKRGLNKGEVFSQSITIEDGSANPPTFDTLEQIMKHYNLKPVEE